MEAKPMLQKVAFTMVPVVDSTRARAFYEEVLGLRRGLASPDGVSNILDSEGNTIILHQLTPTP